MLTFCRFSDAKSGRNGPIVARIGLSEGVLAADGPGQPGPQKTTNDYKCLQKTTRSGGGGLVTCR